MVALRFAYLLALMVWLGGLVVLGAVVAPALFGVLRDRIPAEGQALAGVVFGTMLGQFHLVAAVCGVLMLVALVGMALLGPRPRPFGARLILIALMLAATGISGLPVARRISALSTTLLSATVFGGAWLLFWETRERHR